MSPVERARAVLASLTGRDVSPGEGAQLREALRDVLAHVATVEADTRVAVESEVAAWVRGPAAPNANPVMRCLLDATAAAVLDGAHRSTK